MGEGDLERVLTEARDKSVASFLRDSMSESSSVDSEADPDNESSRANNSSIPNVPDNGEEYTFHELNERVLCHHVLPIQPQLNIIPVPIRSKVVPLVIDVRERCPLTYVTGPTRGSGSGCYRGVLRCGVVNLWGIVSICGGLRSLGEIA